MGFVLFLILLGFVEVMSWWVWGFLYWKFLEVFFLDKVRFLFWVIFGKIIVLRWRKKDGKKYGKRGNLVFNEFLFWCLWFVDVGFLKKENFEISLVFRWWFVSGIIRREKFLIVNFSIGKKKIR